MEVQLETRRFRVKNVIVEIKEKDEGYGRRVRITSKEGLDETIHVKNINIISKRYIVFGTFKRTKDQIVVDGILGIVIGAELSKQEKIIGFVENGGIHVATVYNTKEKTSNAYLYNEAGKLVKTKYFIVDKIVKQEEEVEFIGSYIDNEVVIKEKVNADSLFEKLKIIEEVMNNKRLTI